MLEEEEEARVRGRWRGQAKGQACPALWAFPSLRYPCHPCARAPSAHCGYSLRDAGTPQGADLCSVELATPWDTSSICPTYTLPFYSCRPAPSKKQQWVVFLLSKWEEEVIGETFCSPSICSLNTYLVKPYYVSGTAPWAKTVLLLFPRTFYACHKQRTPLQVLGLHFFTWDRNKYKKCLNSLSVPLIPQVRKIYIVDVLIFQE